MNKAVLEGRGLNPIILVKSDRPLVKSDQSSTQDPSTNIKATEQVGEEKNFPQPQEEEDCEEIVEKYQEQLKTYGVYPNHRPGEDLVPNPKFAPVLAVLTKIPRHRAERSIQAFLKWLTTAKNVKNVYKALEIAILKGWE